MNKLKNYNVIYKLYRCFLISFIGVIIFIITHFFLHEKHAAFAGNKFEKNVIISIYPLYIHALNISGGKLKIDILLPSGVNVHDFSCRPSDIKKIAESKLIIVNGASADDFAIKIAGNYDHLKIIDASYGIELIHAAGHTCGHAHNHAHENNGHKHNNEFNHNKNNGITSNGSHIKANTNPDGLYDPHTWLSLKNAVIQVNNITKAFCELDPENTEFYRKNAARYIGEINVIQNNAEIKLAPYKNSKFIIFHGSFAYFARDCGLIQESIADSFGNAPKPSRIKEIYDTINNNGIKFLVSEPGFQNKEITALQEQYSLETIQLDPMGLYEPAGEIEKYFIETMNENINKLADAFKKNSAAVKKDDKK